MISDFTLLTSSCSAVVESRVVKVVVVVAVVAVVVVVVEMVLPRQKRRNEPIGLAFHRKET